LKILQLDFEIKKDPTKSVEQHLHKEMVLFQTIFCVSNQG